MPTTDRHLSQHEAAEYLGVTSRTIRTYIAAGHLRAFRIKGSRTIRLRVADLDAMLEQVPTTGSAIR